MQFWRRLSFKLQNTKKFQNHNFKSCRSWFSCFLPNRWHVPFRLPLMTALSALEPSHSNLKAYFLPRCVEFLAPNLRTLSTFCLRAGTGFEWTVRDVCAFASLFTVARGGTGVKLGGRAWRLAFDDSLTTFTRIVAFDRHLNLLIVLDNVYFRISRTSRMNGLCSTCTW